MPDEQVCHEDLDAAHDAAMEQVAEEEGNEEEVIEEEPAEEAEETEEIPEEPPADPGANQERSKLGRKLQGVETDLQGMKEMLQILIHQKQASAATPEPEDEEEDDIVTKKELKKVIPKLLSKQKQKEQTMLKQYNNDFANRVLDLGRDLSDEEFDGITKIIDQDFVMETKNSKYDAIINFNKAKAKYYQTKSTTKVNPLAKNEGKVVKNLGGKPTTKTTPKSNLKKPTDKVAQQLIKDMGLSDEFVDEALSKPLPTNLGGTG